MIRAMKRFSGVDDGSDDTMLGVLFYWILGGLILVACIVIVLLLAYRQIFLFVMNFELGSRLFSTTPRPV